MSKPDSADKGLPAGAWLVYAWDHGPYAISLHATCEEAARANAGSGYGSIGFWPFGTEMGDAIKAWESKPTRVLPSAEGRA